MTEVTKQDIREIFNKLDNHRDTLIAEGLGVNVQSYEPKQKKSKQKNNFGNW